MFSDPVLNMKKKVRVSAFIKGLGLKTFSWGDKFHSLKFFNTTFKKCWATMDDILGHPWPNPRLKRLKMDFLCGLFRDFANYTF